MTQSHRHPLLDTDRPHTRVSDAGRMRAGAAYSAAGVRKPPKEETALGGRRTMPRDRAKSRQTTFRRSIGSSRGFNVWGHLYFQELGRSKNATPHNLNVRSSIFESHEAN